MILAASYADGYEAAMPEIKMEVGNRQWNGMGVDALVKEARRTGLGDEVPVASIRQ